MTPCLKTKQHKIKSTQTTKSHKLNIQLTYTDKIYSDIKLNLKGSSSALARFQVLNRFMYLETEARLGTVILHKEVSGQVSPCSLTHSQ